MRLLLSVFTLFAMGTSHGQLLPDSILHQQSLKHAEAFYNRAMEGNFHIYNGAQYTAYQSQKDEHPYFLSDEWAWGNILYDGEWFFNVPLLFDIEKQVLITSYYFKGIKMQLNSSRIDEFTLGNYNFIHLRAADSTKSSHGFYQVLFGNKTLLLAFNEKKYAKEVSGTQMTYYFNEKQQLFLWYKERLIRADNRANILRSIPEHKKQLKVFLRKANTSNNAYTSFIPLAQYLDSLP